MKRFAFSGWTGLILLAGCGGAGGLSGQNPAAARAAPGADPAALCARRHPGDGPHRLGASGQGASVALASLEHRTFAYVADEDSRALHVVDVDRGTQTARTTLPGAPSQVLVLADGRVAVALRDQGRIAVLEPSADPDAPPELLCSLPVPAEPVALATTPDDRLLLVTSGWDHALTALDTSTMKPKFGASLGREPRAVVVDDDGERAFVSHVVGAKLSVVDLTTDRHEVRRIDLSVRKRSAAAPIAGDDPSQRAGAQGFALAKLDLPSDSPGERPLVKGQAPKVPAPGRPKGRVFAPMVTVDPGDARVASAAYYGPVPDGVAKEAPIVSVIDPAAERSLTRAVLSLGTPLTSECLLPRSAATRATTHSLFVACLGTDALLELDTRGPDPMRLERRRWRLPSGPTGVAVDEEHGRAVVWSQFEGALSVIDLDTKDAPTRRVAVRYEPIAGVRAIAAGRRIFHRTGDTRIAFDGIACASCHPEGREDSLTWATPDGPRQTIMLAGRMEGTAPYGWLGRHGDLQSYMANTLSRLGGTGLSTAELESLAAYVNAISGPPADWAARDEDAARRGRELFFGPEQGCASCHLGGPGTDKVVHDVASAAISDAEPHFDTPSLRFIGGTAPYFHDGRYATLQDVLSANDARMGHTAHLGPRDVAALRAYLETL